MSKDQELEELLDALSDEEGVQTNTFNEVKEQEIEGPPVGPSISMSEPPIKVIAPQKPFLENLPAVSDKRIPLTRQQELNTAILSYQLYVQDKEVSPDAIRSIWPTNPELLYKAGVRPTLTAIHRHMDTDVYRKDMLERGISVEDDLTVGAKGLTAEQIAVISHLTDTTTTKGIPSRLKDLGVKPATYRAWLRQKPFSDAIKKLAGSALDDAIPMAETMLATQASAGDLRAIKFLFEVTGRHDPMRQQQVDTQALIGVMIDCIQEVLGAQPELLKELIDEITIRSKGVKGVLR